MRQSNLYVIGFSVALTIILGGLLSIASEGLAPIQKKSIELDTKKQILNAVMELKKQDDVLKIYDERIASIVVDINGKEIEKDEEGNKLIAENISIEKEFKKKPENRKFPVFIYAENGERSAYILPVYGVGLWDNIWGFVAMDTDGITIKGVSFAHAGETPGLGARITESGVQARYESKKIYNDAGELVSIQMLKGENNDASKINDHTVDGMSGATITANGLNDMLKNYFNYYGAYFKNMADSQEEIAPEVEEAELDEEILNESADEVTTQTIN